MIEKLFNWSEISRIIKPEGDRGIVRRNDVPNIYKEQVEELLDFARGWKERVQAHRKLKEETVYKKLKK